MMLSPLYDLLMLNPLLSAVNDNIFSGATQQRTSGVVYTGFSNINILDRMSLISFVIPFILYFTLFCKNGGSHPCEKQN